MNILGETCNNIVIVNNAYIDIVNGNYEKALVSLSSIDNNTSKNMLSECLIVACNNICYEIVLSLLNKGANPNYTCDDLYNNKITPLLATFRSSMEDQLEQCKIIRVLIERGANYNYLYTSNLHLLHFACYYGFYEAVELLVEKNINIDHLSESGTTGLMLAAMKNHENIVRFLVEKGSNINIFNDNFDTPIKFAMLNKNESLVGYLILNGAYK
jgi:ankyrin repeat protein